MSRPQEIHLLSTSKEKCRLCFTCVRECPAKAIRVEDGQAQVVPSRCIACGHCVRVCSQGAKKVVSSIHEAEALLNSSHRVAALVAPSFPAEFREFNHRQLVGRLRTLGFDYVVEVGAGADVVANEYRRLLEENPDKRFIATTCPAVVGYVERYHPNLLDNLAPIASPMVAIAHLAREHYGEDLKTVFVGPCIAKKGEALASGLEGVVDAVLTFAELREIFTHHAASFAHIQESEFDPPHASQGALFPLSRGMLQAANLTENLLNTEIVSADGNEDFIEALKEFESGFLQPKLLDLLCCHGCIMGAGITNPAPVFSRRAAVSHYVRNKVTSEEKAQLPSEKLHREYQANDQRVPLPSQRELVQILARMGKTRPEDELDCSACGYPTCRDHAIAIHKGLAEAEMCLPYSIERLRATVTELADSNERLDKAREALLHSEKLASMGQLAAGIAHEVNNPLGVVLMYAHLLLDQAQDQPQMKEDLELIACEADRCKKIVGGLLDFARQNKVFLEESNLTELLHQSTKAVKINDQIKVEFSDEMANPICEFDKSQITQVLTNLVSNACAAMPDGGTIRIRAFERSEQVAFSVEDTGTGIDPSVRKKNLRAFRDYQANRARYWIRPRRGLWHRQNAPRPDHRRIQYRSG